MSCNTRTPIARYHVRLGRLYTPVLVFCQLVYANKLVVVYIDRTRKVVCLFVVALVCRYTLHPLEVLGKLHALRGIV